MKRQRTNIDGAYQTTPSESSISTLPSDYSNLEFPGFAKPQEIACMSVDNKKNALLDQEELVTKYFVPPNKFNGLYFDLNSGFEESEMSFQEVKELKFTLKPLLQWLISKKGSKSLKETAFGADFVSWRGLLTRICSSPYEKRGSGWKFGIVRFQDVYFLREYQTDKAILQTANMSERERRMTYWGHKFETYVISENAEMPDPNTPVQEIREYCSIVKTNVSESAPAKNGRNYRLVFGGEVDCKDRKSGKFLEVKTNRLISDSRQEENFYKFKAWKWWIQSFLIGIETIVCGFRTDGGIVKKMEIFQVKDLAKNSQEFWNPSVSMNFLLAVLNLITDKITENNPNKEFFMEWQPGQQFIILNRLTDNKDNSFLPAWFIKEFV